MTLILLSPKLHNHMLVLQKSHGHFCWQLISVTHTPGIVRLDSGRVMCERIRRALNTANRTSKLLASRVDVLRWLATIWPHWVAATGGGLLRHGVVQVLSDGSIVLSLLMIVSKSFCLVGLHFQLGLAILRSTEHGFGF